MAMKRWRDLTADERAGMGDAETISRILADNEVDGWIHAKNVRYLETGIVDVRSLTDAQLEHYYALLEEALEDSQRLGNRLTQTDKAAWRVLRREDRRRSQEREKRWQRPLERLKRAGIRVLAAPIEVLIWIFDVFSSGNEGVGVSGRRSRTVIQGAGNWLMAVTVIALLIVPLLTATGICDLRPTACLLLPTACLMSIYAPWYTILGTLPFWVFYAAVTSITFGLSDRPSVQWEAAWIFLWYLYPLVRGFFHIMQWDRERKAKVPYHRVTKHPWAAAAASAAVAIGAHHTFGQRGKR
jgi:hypothetical protein